MSHKTTIKWVKELAENHDEPVLKWKAKCEAVSATMRESASPSLSVSSDEESESKEVTICTHSEDETPPSTPHGDRSPPSMLNSEHSHQVVPTPAVTPIPPNYILVGDNWDKNVWPRHTVYTG